LVGQQDFTESETVAHPTLRQGGAEKRHDACCAQQNFMDPRKKRVKNEEKNRDRCAN